MKKDIQEKGLEKSLVGKTIESALVFKNEYGCIEKVVLKLSSGEHAFFAGCDYANIIVVGVVGENGGAE